MELGKAGLLEAGTSSVERELMADIERSRTAATFLNLLQHREGSSYISPPSEALPPLP